MKRSYRTQLAGQIGENLVVAELGRRGIIATSFAGNVPDIDLLAFANDISLPIQVKSWRSGSVHFNATRFIEIEFDGDRQIVRGLDEALDKNLVYVFVKIGESLGKDRFFLLRQGDLQKTIHDNYKSWLNKHGGIRPRNPKTTHVSVELGALLEFEGNWSLVENRLGFKLSQPR